MNELKPEDVMISCDKTQPSDERSALREYRRRIYEAVNYRGTDDHEDVTTILLEYKKALIREKDAEIERLKAHNKELNNLCDLLHKKLDEGYAEFSNEERAEAITEFAERLKKFYSHLKGNTVGGSVEYHIDQIVKEMKGEHNNGNQNQT